MTNTDGSLPYPTPTFACQRCMVLVPVNSVHVCAGNSIMPAPPYQPWPTPGWVCPMCQSVWSPSVSCCPSCFKPAARTERTESEANVLKRLADVRADIRIEALELPVEDWLCLNCGRVWFAQEGHCRHCGPESRRPILRAGDPPLPADEIARRLALIPRPPYRHCCYVNQRTAVPCDWRAEWMVVHGGGPDDYTDACTKHLGEMMTDAAEHRVYRIEPEAGA